MSRVQEPILSLNTIAEKRKIYGVSGLRGMAPGGPKATKLNWLRIENFPI